MASCEWPDVCQEAATHTVTVSFPGEAVETWHVCRAHERILKMQAVSSRPKKPPEIEQSLPNVVRCGSCDQVINERSDMAHDRRLPCPECGSTARKIESRLTSRVSFHDSFRARKKVPNKVGWMLDTRSGDDYTADLGAWGKGELTKDREHDLYREVIELWDGTRIESTARLRDHHD